jgi:hypothetical protein
LKSFTANARSEDNLFICTVFEFWFSCASFKFSEIEINYNITNTVELFLLFIYMWTFHMPF